MAVFGNLTEFPLLEVFGMLERRCGVLRFTRVGRFANLEFHLNNAQLQGLVVDGKVMRDGLMAKNLLVEIANIRDGKFEFQRVPVGSDVLLNDLAISINEVLLRRATLDDEWNNYRENLPDGETRFMLSSQELVWLDGDLQFFWNQAEPLLEYGISAKDLAVRLSLEVKMVQVNLYKLRVLGVIRPARRMQEVSDIRAGNFPGRESRPAPVYIPPVAPQAKPTLVSRLLGALRFFGKPA